MASKGALAELRRGCGFSQEKVSEDLDAPQAAISAYERGVYFPSVERLIELGVEYGTTDLARLYPDLTEAALVRRRERLAQEAAARAAS